MGSELRFLEGSGLNDVTYIRVFTRRFKVTERSH